MPADVQFLTPGDVTMTPAEIYADLERRSLPLLDAYERDLTVHDRNTIEENPGRMMLHWTKGNGCGTWMCVLLETKDLPQRGELVPYLFALAGREHIAKGPEQTARLILREIERGDHAPKLVLWWDRRRWQEITPEKAVEIAANHLRSLHREWDDELTKSVRLLAACC